MVRALTLLLLLTLSASAQTPRIPPPESVNRNGLVGRWLVPGNQTGNGLTPAMVLDDSGNRKALTTVGSPTFGVLLGRTMLAVNGSSQYAQSGLGVFSMGSNNFTVTLWVKSSNTANYQAMIATASAYAVRGFNVVTEATSGKLRALYDNTVPWTGGVYTWPSSKNLCDGKWHFVAVSFTFLGSMVGYVDGVSLGGFSIATQNRGLVNNEPLVIGGNSQYTGDKFAGSLCDVRIYSRALAPSEVSAIYRGLQ
jgi:hypothetical protein